MPEPAGASSALLQTALAELMVVAHRTDDDPDGVITDVNDLVDRLLDPGAGPFPSGYEVRVRLYASSVIINAAMVSNDVAALELGVQWAAAALDNPGLGHGELLSAGYNRANAFSAIVKIRGDQRFGAQPALGWPVAYRDTRSADRDLLATARAGFHTYATQFPDPEEQSTGWCNLANEFDLSGRWLEA